MPIDPQIPLYAGRGVPAIVYDPLEAQRKQLVVDELRARTEDRQLLAQQRQEQMQAQQLIQRSMQLHPDDPQKGLEWLRANGTPMAYQAATKILDDHYTVVSKMVKSKLDTQEAKTKRLAAITSTMIDEPSYVRGQFQIFQEQLATPEEFQRTFANPWHNEMTLGTVKQYSEQARTDADRLAQQRLDLDQWTKRPDTADKWEQFIAQKFATSDNDADWKGAQAILMYWGAPPDAIRQYGESWSAEAQKKAQAQQGASAAGSGGTPHPIQMTNPDGTKRNTFGIYDPATRAWQEVQGGSPIPTGINTPGAEEDRDTLSDMLRHGQIIPSYLNKRQDYNSIIAEASRKNVAEGKPPLDAMKMEADWKAASRFASSMNSNQILNFKRLATTTSATIEEVLALSDELRQGGIQLFNKATRNTVLQVFGNTEMADKAARYVMVMNTLKADMAQLENGGFAPQEASWKLANEQINSDFSMRMLHAALPELQRVIGFRMKATDVQEPMMMGGPSSLPFVQSGTGETPITPDELRGMTQAGNVWDGKSTPTKGMITTAKNGKKLVHDGIDWVPDTRK